MQKISRLQAQFPQGKTTYKPLRTEMLNLGLTPQTTYFIYAWSRHFRRHSHAPARGICEMLRREREREIRKFAEHNVQMQNELSAYQNATASIEEMLRKHTAYMDCPLYQRVQNDIGQWLALRQTPAPDTAVNQAAEPIGPKQPQTTLQPTTQSQPKPQPQSEKQTAKHKKKKKKAKKAQCRFAILTAKGSLSYRPFGCIASLL